MKKVLLGTSALIAAGLLAAPASAAEKIKLGLGGKMEQYFAVTSMDDSPAYDPTMTGINTDTEVYFTGATTLDNGLTVGAVIQLEAQTQAAGGAALNADEQYAYIEGAFGKIMAGQKDGVSAQLAHTSPQIGITRLDAASFAPAGSGFVNKVVDTTVSSDDATVSYISPNLAGFSLGLSWTPTPGGALQDNTVGTGQHNQFEAALAYNGEFSGIGIGADVAYIGSTADDAVVGTDPENVKTWRAGLVVSYAGFQFGGSYMANDDIGGTDDLERDTWDVGLAYQTGPYGVGINYVNSELDNAANDESSYQQVLLTGAYQMGPGVTATAGLFWADSEIDMAGTTVGDFDTDGTGGIVALQLSF